ncbi:hypothetical protein SeMB42_g04459 [Synchytrium endobioticum]|uniref:Uncharacterized protein n=1 Tax=Synchytrium endobioticum TaxID=286115 RepID=A0A507CY33_9FUNG|nr:hypothetical protein SeMB42_g04459 [Synchytrium endobioticum]
MLAYFILISLLLLQPFHADANEPTAAKLEEWRDAIRQFRYDHVNLETRVLEGELFDRLVYAHNVFHEHHTLEDRLKLGASITFSKGKKRESVTSVNAFLIRIFKRDRKPGNYSCKAALVANRWNRGNKYLFKAHWTPNPFMPLQSVGEVPRYTSWIKDRTTPIQMPSTAGIKSISKGRRVRRRQAVLMKKLAADIDAVFGNQIVGMLPLLKQRVVEVVGEEGRLAIEYIKGWVDECLQNDPPNPPPPVQVFYEINRLLPGPYRCSRVPHTSFGDGYVTMSEECLFDLLFDISSFQKTVREVAGVGLKADLCRECTKSGQETWAEFLERFVTTYNIARTYYSSKKYKRKRWDADKAKRGELDKCDGHDPSCCQKSNIAKVPTSSNMDASHIVLIITCVVFAILVVIAAIYFLIYFQHPDDKWVAWFPKVLVILGLSVSSFNIFLLPLDVANQGGTFEGSATGSLPMFSLSLAFYIATMLMGLLFVPFTVYYYEGLDDSDDSDDHTSNKSQLAYAVKWMVPTVVVVGLVYFLLYWFYGYADVYTTQLAGVLVATNGSDIIDTCQFGMANSTYCHSSNATLQIGVSWLVYVVALTSLVGWLLFSVFGGVGIVSLPVDLIQDYKHRPKPIKATEYAERKKIIGQQSQILMEAGKQLMEELKVASRTTTTRFTDRKFRRVKNRETEFRKDVMILEAHYRYLEDSYKAQGGNALLQLALLLLGIVGCIISFFWILHVILYALPVVTNSYPLSPFLNSFFSGVGQVPFLGTAFYALFAFYLLACVVKGNIKLGMKIIFITIHPLRFGETMMNSMVFNIGVILFCSLSVAQFCTLSFGLYAKYTSSYALFGVQLQNLRGIHWGFSGFVYVFETFAFLTMMYMVYRPYNKQRENQLQFKY